MNERQRDLFLWQWANRRRVGIRRVGMRGALIGAVGGLVFALVLMTSMGQDGPRGFPWLLEQLSRAAMLLLLSVPSFGLFGYLTTRRIFLRQERMFERLLSSGATVPAQAPLLSIADRWPAILVGVSVLVIGALIVAAIVFLG